jgi:hypothetical protein
MGKCPCPTLCGVCHTLAAIGRLPLSKHTGGGGATPAFSHRLVYLQFVWSSAPPPVLWWSVPHNSQQLTASVTRFPFSKVAGQRPPLLPSPASLFIFSSHEWVPLSLSPELKAPHLLCYVSFFFFSAACLLFSLVFFLFSLGGGHSVWGLCWFVPWSAVCPLSAHLVVSQAG